MHTSKRTKDESTRNALHLLLHKQVMSLSITVKTISNQPHI